MFSPVSLDIASRSLCLAVAEVAKATREWADKAKTFGELLKKIRVEEVGIGLRAFANLINMKFY